MKELILAIVIACSLGMSGCTEDNPQSTGNKQIDDALGIKTEEKVEEPEKKEEKKKEQSKKEEKKKTEEEEERELTERVSKRNIVIGNCHVCNKVMQRNDDYEDTDEYGFICRSCYNKGVTKCTRCGKTINCYADSSHTGSSGVYCDACYDAMYDDDYNDYYYGEDYGDYCCEECGVGLAKEEVCEQNGRMLCPDCALGESRRQSGLDDAQ